MGFVKGSFKAFLFIGFLFFLHCVFAEENINEEIKSYIVHLGKRQHDDPELVSDSHQRMLESVFESPEAARESIIYNYHHGFSGFAARLTESQAKKLSANPDVLRIAPNGNVKLTGTRVYDYLGLSPTLPTGILQESNMGSDLVIGFIDSGIWPETPGLSDEGLGPIPKHWKGKCVAGQGFDPAIHCNKKLVGAKFYLDKLGDKYGGAIVNKAEDFLSPRASSFHGPSVTSIAASRFVPNVSVSGLAHGVLRGAAPNARVAMYKAVWATLPWSGGIANVLKAFDDAINDGVDVLSISLAPGETPFAPFNNPDEDLEIGSFYAVMKGIPVIAGAGNSGPDAYTVVNVPPWLFTVAATGLDRAFVVDMTFGNNVTIMGQSVYWNKKEVNADLAYVEDWEYITSDVFGKVVLTFVKTNTDIATAWSSIINAKAVGVIIARTSDFQPELTYSKPSIHVSFEVGSEILRYIRSSSLPTVKVSLGKTLVGRPIGTQVASFSSRGPNSVNPAILKPDIAAPGETIVAVNPRTGYHLAIGTSFATPVVAGLVVLLKAVHPDWSPAALKSAMMTTAWKTDKYGSPITADGQPRKLADPFDYGAGLVNIEKAKDPGLIYDMNLDDYIHYFCASGYSDTNITVLTGKPTKCSSPLPSILDVNYPAITIPNLENEVNVTRTVTNVGPVDSVYRPVIEAPQGVQIDVEPKTLVFNSSTKKLVFKVRVSSSHKSDTGYFFGSFTWTDGTRNVNIPLSVRTRVLR